VQNQAKQAQGREEGVRQAGALVKNSNYQVIIKRAASKGLRPIEIRANLPETFSFGVSAEYNADLGSSLEELAQGFGAVGRTIGEVFGQVNNFVTVNRVAQQLTHQKWKSSSPISFSIPLLFDAVSSAEEDVVAPIRDLMALTLPYKEDSEAIFLRPPGPSLVEPDHGRISLKIGNMNYFHSVLLKDVSANFSSRFTKSGAPISAECDVTFETVTIPAQEDIDLFFMYASRNVTQSQREQYGKVIKEDGSDATNEFGRVVEKLKNRVGNFFEDLLPVGKVTSSIRSRTGVDPSEIADIF
jgi:hypothetical protein